MASLDLLGSQLASMSFSGDEVMGAVTDGKDIAGAAAEETKKFGVKLGWFLVAVPLMGFPIAGLLMPISPFPSTDKPAAPTHVF